MRFCRPKQGQGTVDQEPHVKGKHRGPGMTGTSSVLAAKAVAQMRVSRRGNLSGAAKCRLRLSSALKNSHRGTEYTMRSRLKIATQLFQQQRNQQTLTFQICRIHRRPQMAMITSSTHKSGWFRHTGVFVIDRETRGYLELGDHLPEASVLATHTAPSGYRKTHDTCLESIHPVSPEALSPRPGATTSTWKPCPLSRSASISTRPFPVHLDACMALLRIQSNQRCRHCVR